MSSTDAQDVEYIGQSSPKPIPNPIIVLPIDDEDQKSDTSYSVDSDDCVSIKSQDSKMESSSSEEKNVMSSSVTLTTEMHSSQNGADSSKVSDKNLEKEGETQGAMSEHDDNDVITGTPNQSTSCPVHGELQAVYTNDVFPPKASNADLSKRDEESYTAQEEVINPFYLSQTAVLSNAELASTEENDIVNSGHLADNEASESGAGTIVQQLQTPQLFNMNFHMSQLKVHKVKHMKLLINLKKSYKVSKFNI